MSDTEIETTIRRLLLFKQSVNNNKENEIHVKDIQKQLIKICEKFHFFYKKILSNKNFNYEKLILEIIKNLEFVYKKENEVIWNVGDKVNEMYIIFLGEINIYKYQNKNDDEEPQLDYILEKGYTLGEDSLKNNSIRRTYLAKSRSFCILGKLTLKEYNRIFSRLLNEENILINSFLRDLKMFSNDFIDRFKKNVLINYYNKNDYIFKQNESFRTFYFIYSGTVRLILKLNKTVKSKLDYDILIGKDPKQRFSNSRLFELRGNYKETLNYNLIDLTIGDIIGGIEYCYHYNNYKYDAKCLTDVELLKIDLIHFNKILMKEEMEIFNKKIENQFEMISLRIKNIKEGRKIIKLNDYILSKEKFTKAFLLNYPLTKKYDIKSELYINSGSNPLKIKYKYNKKKLKNTKLSLNSLDDYKYENKNININKNKYNNNMIKIKDFFTNIDYNHKVPVGDIFPNYFSIENIPSNNNKKVYFINKNMNKNNIIYKTNKIFKNKTISSLTTYFDFKNRNKNRKLNFKTISHKNNKLKLIKKNEIKNKIIFNNENIREKLYLHYLNKNNTKSQNYFSNGNSIISK